jgi:hypothetical protein
VRKIILLLFLPILGFSQIEEKSEKCKIIYNNIINAIGNNNPQKPRFVFSTSTNNPAYISNNKIYFEEKLYDALLELGDKQEDGIAFILSHELAHHYLKHAWMKKAGYGFKNTQIGQTLINFEAIKIEETAADYYAGFYAHLSGYESLSIADQVLDIVYNSYQLDSNITGYPSLYERKKISDSRKQELQQLTDIFDIANLALLTSHYNNAVDCYEYILNEGFTSREIYNNLGLSFIYSALELLDKKKYKYYLPTSLDLNTRAEIQSTRGIGIYDHKIKAIELLEMAIEKFDRSILLDKNYKDATINKAAALLLLATLDVAFEDKFFIQLTLLESDTDHFRAIYYALSDKKRDAKKYFKKENTNSIAIYNYNIFNSKEGLILNNNNIKLIIDDIDLNDLTFSFPKPYRRINKIPGNNIKIKDLKNTTSYSIGRDLIIHATNTSLFTTNTIIKYGITSELVVEELGMPNNIINSKQKKIYIYKKLILSFKENRLEKIILTN